MQATVQVNEAYTFLRDYDNRFEVVMGGAGSGKSYSVAQHIILGVLDPANQGRKYLCLRKIGKSLRHSVFSLLKSIIWDMGLGEEFIINKTDMSFTLKGSGREILLGGLDDVEKLKSVHDVTDIWIEEATEVTQSDLIQLNLRLRGKGPKKRIILTFNPISQLHWLKGYFFDTPQDNTRITTTTYKDNAFLDDAYREELESLRDIDPYYYQVYTLGEWGRLGNLVFSNFVIEDFPYSEDDLENICEGMDFGYIHASAIVRMGFRDGELYAFDELCGKGWTNADFIANAEEHFGNAKHVMQLTADSAEPDRIDEWNRAGWNVTPAKKGGGSLRYGIDYLAQHRWHIHGSRCPQLANEVQLFKRREDKDGNVNDKDFVELNDDAIAASRYGTEFIWGQYHGVLADYGGDIMGALGL